MDGGHAQLQGTVVHEAEDVAKPSGCQSLHVDLVLVPLPHVCREHDPEVVALGGQERLVSLQKRIKLIIQTKKHQAACFKIHLPVFTRFFILNFPSIQQEKGYKCLPKSPTYTNGIILSR